MTHLSQLEHAILQEVACATYIVQDKKIDTILYVFGQPPQWSLASAILNLAAILSSPLQMVLGTRLQEMVFRIRLQKRVDLTEVSYPGYPASCEQALN